MEKAGRAARQSCVERTDKTAAVLPKDTCCGESTAGRAGNHAGTHRQSQLRSTPLQAETKLCITMYIHKLVSQLQLYRVQWHLHHNLNISNESHDRGGHLIQPLEHIRMRFDSHWQSRISTIWRLTTFCREDSAHPFRGGGYRPQPPVEAWGQSRKWLDRLIELNVFFKDWLPDSHYGGTVISPNGHSDTAAKKIPSAPKASK